MAYISLAQLTELVIGYPYPFKIHEFYYLFQTKFFPTFQLHFLDNVGPTKVTPGYLLLVYQANGLGNLLALSAISYPYLTVSITQA